ncbi:uncharacterized protein LOC120327120 isoform X1 [Styela clava]
MNDIEIMSSPQPGSIPISSTSKSIVNEISPVGGTLKVGLCNIRYLPKSVSESQNIKLTLSINNGNLPEHHVQASVTLTCEPTVLFRKAIHIQLPTWLVTDKSVDVSIYTKQSESDWIELDSAAVTDERIFDIQLKELSNITAFLHKRSLPNVNFMLKPYLFSKDVSSFKVALGFSDQISESCLNADMKIGGCSIALHKMKEIIASLGDEIHYKLTTDDKVENQPSCEGQINITEGFLETVRGHSNAHDLQSVPSHPLFMIKQVREMNGTVEIISEESSVVAIQPHKGPSCQTNVEFLGSVQAENVITDAGDVKIDQRVLLDGAQPEMCREKNNFRYEKVRRMTSNPTQPSQPGLTLMSERPNKVSNIRFLGNVKVKNLIGNAGNVTIDQRRMCKTEPATTSNAIQPENDLHDPVQVAGQPLDDSDDDETEISDKSQSQTDVEMEEKNAQESAIGSDRTFNT